MPRKSIKMSKAKERKFNELNKKAKMANQRILKIEREFGKDSWAVKKLRDVLDTISMQAWTESRTCAC